MIVDGTNVDNLPMSQKSPQVRGMIESMFPTGTVFLGTLELIRNKQCPLCESTITLDSFKDELSKLEYRVSGMCQKCQDAFWAFKGE
jgi:hypothetical protein